jgi:hypothetical protein
VMRDMPRFSVEDCFSIYLCKCLGCEPKPLPGPGSSAPACVCFCKYRPWAIKGQSHSDNMQPIHFSSCVQGSVFRTAQNICKENNTISFSLKFVFFVDSFQLIVHVKKTVFIIDILSH